MIFKIRRTRDGLYSDGGINPSFSKTGKQWNNKGALNSHLNLLYNNTYDRKCYEGCEIVRFVLEEKGCASFDFRDEQLRKLIVDTMNSSKD